MGAVKLAKAIGITRTSLNSYIKGETKTQPRVRAKIASYYLRETRREEEQAGRAGEEQQRVLARAAEARADYGPGEIAEELMRSFPSTREAAFRWIGQLFREDAEGVDTLKVLFFRIAHTLPPEEPAPDDGA